MQLAIYIGGAVVFFAMVMASIALHEVGHLVPGKMFGVKTTQYFVGFGRTLWSRRKGETEYGLKLIPLGGYVRFVGMFPPAKTRPGQVRTYSTGSFRSLADNARAIAAYRACGFVEEGRLRESCFVDGSWHDDVVMGVLDHEFADLDTGPA